MKKVLGFLIMAVVAMLPFAVDAATSIGHSCAKDENGIYNCTITYNMTTAETDVVVTLTEIGGAEVISIDSTMDSDWTVSKSKSNNVWTVNLSSPGVSGEGNLFSFSYKPSGTEECAVHISLGDKKIELIPEVPEDTPTENKDTGSTLPYIALATIALAAAGAYVATKNKSKVYKI